MKYYKCARPNGWDFYTGKTINYRKNIGKTVTVPHFTPETKQYRICSPLVLHASKKPLEALSYAKLPCSVFTVEGKAVVKDTDKCGFTHLTVLEEIPSNVLDELFGFKFLEACNPIHPLKVQADEVGEAEILLLKQWASIRASIWDSVWDSVWNSVRASVWASIWASIWDSVGVSVWFSVGTSIRNCVGASIRASIRDSVWDSVWVSVRDSIRDSVGAYIGSLFPKITEWKYTPKSGGYPYQSCVDLWKRGFAPSFDGKVWRLHAGEKAESVYEIGAEKLQSFQTNNSNSLNHQSTNGEIG